MGTMESWYEAQCYSPLIPPRTSTNEHTWYDLRDYFFFRGYVCSSWASMFFSMGPGSSSTTAANTIEMNETRRNKARMETKWLVPQCSFFLGKVGWVSLSSSWFVNCWTDYLPYRYLDRVAPVGGATHGERRALHYHRRPSGYRQDSGRYCL